MTGSPRLPRARIRVLAFQLLTVAVALLVTAGCRLTDLRLWGPGGPAAESCRVEVIRDVAYYSGPYADERRHRLDLFLPQGKKAYPVVLLVHGGAWMTGDNRCCGLYSSVGEFLASQGIGVVLPNHRLSPGVRHPEHVKDVARAFAWAREHVDALGGRSDQIFLIGHSSGGHLVALLATDDRYLQAEGLHTEDIRGVVAVCGVYRLPPGNVAVALGGASPQRLSLDEVTPFRGAGGWAWTRRLGLPGMPLELDVFGPAFGSDPLVRADASPVNHVRPGLPPFLILSAEHDLPGLPGMAEEFHCALVGQGCDSRLLEIQERNHSSILFRAIEPHDPAARAILEFIHRHCSGGPLRAEAGSF
jgi:acetyl esterase/lipase